jgi:hypothetical protein
LAETFLSIATILVCFVFMLWQWKRSRNVHYSRGHAASAREAVGNN